MYLQKVQKADPSRNGKMDVQQCFSDTSDRNSEKKVGVWTCCRKIA